MTEDKEKKPAVLVIEDNQATRKLIVSQLKTLGYQNIKDAASGTHAIELLEKDPGGFPIAVIDIYLEDMTAELLARRLPPDHGIQNLLILSSGTAKDFSAVRAGFYRQGIAEVHTVKKPASLETLRRLLG